MKMLCWFLLLTASAGLMLGLAVARPQAQDQAGCKDYPLFNRMPNVHIVDCQTVEFDARKFPVGPPVEEMKPKHVEVEGTLIFLRYELRARLPQRGTSFEAAGGERANIPPQRARGDLKWKSRCFW